MFSGRGRVRRRYDDSGSMPIALLITLVGVTLSAGLTTLVVGQTRNSRLSADRIAAVAAAQAGLDVGLAKIRAAVTGVSGDISKLPCTTATGTLTALTGTSTSAPPTYTTSVGYFLVDPSSMVGDLRPIGDLTNISKLISGTVSVNGLLTSLGEALPTGTGLTTALSSAIGCVNGALGQVPLYGLLRSTGVVGGAARTLYATYIFHTPEETLNGGPIVIAGAGGLYCLGDASPTPGPDDPVVAILCTSPPAQVFLIYPKNLTLALAQSRSGSTTAYPYGLCITALKQAAREPLVFKACSPTKNSTQQWSYAVNAQTYYGTSNGTTSSGFCLTMDTMTLLSPIILRSGGSCGTAGAPGNAMVPDASVGAGAAGVNTGQLVNYSEVGRCLDLTNEDVTGYWFTSRRLAPALITYPCKQAFSGGVYWNHKWTGPTLAAGQTQATGQISTTPASGTYANVPFCLNSPGAGGGYVWVADCRLGGSALQWTISDATPLLSEAYLIIDQFGHCLEAAGSLGASYQYLTWSEVIVTTCDGSPIQKWNVPASQKAGPLSGIQEK